MRKHSKLTLVVLPAFFLLVMPRFILVRSVIFSSLSTSHLLFLTSVEGTSKEFTIAISELVAIGQRAHK